MILRQEYHLIHFSQALLIWEKFFVNKFNSILDLIEDVVRDGSYDLFYYFLWFIFDWRCEGG